jgi:retron-type reverse transcriptase
VDGVTWDQYKAELTVNIENLYERINRRSCRAKPSQRAYIPKPDGRQRPLAIAVLEDKIVQRTVAEVLNAIYKADFLGFSYGFWPGRQPHKPLDALSVALRVRIASVLKEEESRQPLIFWDSRITAV